MSRALGVTFLVRPTSWCSELVSPVGLGWSDGVLAEHFPSVFVGDGDGGFVDEDDHWGSSVLGSCSEVVHFPCSAE